MVCAATRHVLGVNIQTSSMTRCVPDPLDMRTLYSTRREPDSQAWPHISIFSARLPLSRDDLH